jgi:hypothetical protein
VAPSIFLDDDVAAGQLFQGHLVGTIVAILQARTFQVRRARVFE